MQKDKFRLYIKYMSDSTGVAVNNIPEGNIANKTLLQVMNLDRLDANETEYSDGIFDYIEGYTVQSSNGRIIFPVIEPFGSHLAEQIGQRGHCREVCLSGVVRLDSHRGPAGLRVEQVHYDR